LVFAKPHQVLVMLVLSLSKDWAQPVIFTNWPIIQEMEMQWNNSLSL
jgi:hypothetical protein